MGRGGSVRVGEGRVGEAVAEAGEHRGRIGEIGQHPRGYGPVVVDQVALGVALVGPEDLVEVGELDLSWERGDGRRTLRWHLNVPLPSPFSLFRDLRDWLVIPESHEHRLPEESLVGP